MFLMTLKYKNTKAYFCTGHNEINITKNVECKPLENTKAVMVNGITWDKKNKVFIVDLIEKQINVYKLNLSNSEVLTYQNSIQLSAHADNIEYDERTNQIYAGMIGKMY